MIIIIIMIIKMVARSRQCAGRLRCRLSLAYQDVRGFDASMFSCTKRRTSPEQVGFPQKGFLSVEGNPLLKRGCIYICIYIYIYIHRERERERNIYTYVSYIYKSRLWMLRPVENPESCGASPAFTARHMTRLH